ncbi:replication protein, partial [uncultured marine virus]
MPRFRNICFTHYSHTDLKVFLDICSKIADISYFIGQLEICPSTQRLHLQGYMEFSKQLSRKKIKSYIGEAHIDARQGTQSQAITYCSKVASR